MQDLGHRRSRPARRRQRNADCGRPERYPANVAAPV